ncbi:hypothetical protein GCM10011352_00890 [Marinobacterium zhoushanense]|uniref:DUF3040 domain-containing protein n=1 Tax=Marinobacterium zhoushanense TaxID=1679163 RepID=A0ABQ1JWQ8_9GAMM|nr:hypothetical protein [Marinobacterium zhoushanense]GGB79076.1 hypothetical protein GCM10011352_00890 [Marinobacterium zhoushanense]
MKLNDPFGRMARRREREYHSLCESLKKAGLTDRAKAEELRENLRKRTKKSLWFIMPAIVILALIFQTYAIYVLAFGALVVLWLTNTTQRGTEYLNRYIEEECGGDTTVPDEQIPADNAQQNGSDEEPRER